MNRRAFLQQAMAASACAAMPPGRPLNFLLITADDMNWSTPGCFGGKVPDITPNIDRLASQGLRFERAHVTVAVCQPSRSVLMTGRYPYRNGAEGFNPIREDIPTLQEQLHAAGYLNGIMAKNAHLAPRAKFCWDFYITPEQLGQGRSPKDYYRYTKEFLEKAKSARQPFFLMANSQDPHRPFAGSEQELKNFGKHLPYGRKIEPKEAIVPGFLPDIPKVRQEIAEYMTSAHRCDETVGEVLRALAESGMEQDTLVMFLSDNGMALPFAKTNCYLNSTRTPWIVRWPGKTKAGTVNRREFISGIDFTPTVLEAAGLKQIDGVDGRSFLPLLTGGRQQGRERVFTVFHETSGRQRFEMRCVQNGRFGYIYNAWSDGKRAFRNESQNGLTWRAMTEAAATDARIAERVKLFSYRVPEELYDFQADPDGLRNLAGNPKYKTELERLRRTLRENMVRTGDRLAQQFKG
ncbi:MAG: sulfatase [Bryobacteraceae bacterium]